MGERGRLAAAVQGDRSAHRSCAAHWRRRRRGFFFADKTKKRIEQLVAFQKLVQSSLGTREWEERAAWASDDLLFGERPVRPFYWKVEFPEVFSRANPGFDAIVGNPPFAGKNTLINANAKNYLPWLQTLHEGAHGNADLVAHFFRRAFGLLRQGGVFGLIATNTIGQGDTRASGLTAILQNGGAILRAKRRLKWPGEAAVVVSVVHVVKGAAPSPVLDGRQVRRISAYLVEGDLDVSPEPLATNARKAFQGSIVLGMGFTFDDAAAAKGEAESLATMRALIEKDPRNAERIFPYIGGEEVNTDPRHAYHRYVIDFADFPLRRDPALMSWSTMTATEREDALNEGVVPQDYPEEVGSDWPDLLAIVEHHVKPERLKQKDKIGQKIWWRFLRRRDRLYSAIAPLERVWATGAAAVMYHMISRIPARMVFSHKLVVWASARFSFFACLQGRCHELWSKFLGTTFGSVDALTYNPKAVFRTFPFPENFETDPALEAAGEAYHTLRAQLMIDRGEGLTKTYNRFHAQGDNAPDISHLRQLHAQMDEAVLRTYGWDDLAASARPEFIEQEADEGKTPKTRLDWPAEFKDEVLARLLALNAERAAAERAAGLTTAEDDDYADEAEEA